MRFAPHTDDDVRDMLAACGLSSIEDLFAQIPPSVRLDRPLDLPQGVSEMELVADLRKLAARNRHADDLVCFAGAGAYDHYVPSVVWALAGRSELYTSYTPYQPELSQGVLQALFEYQSMICELTGLEVSNASLYDGPTALEIARTYQPEAVVLDVELKHRWEGHDLARQLRTLPGLEYVYLICMSGYVTERDRKSSEKAGFNYFFVKGADPNELEQILATDGVRHSSAADPIAESRALTRLLPAPEVGACLSADDGRA